MTTLNPGRIVLVPGSRAALATALMWGAAASVAAGALSEPQAPRSSEQPLAVATTGRAGGVEANGTVRVTHVRPVNPMAAALLQKGPARSATVARLLETLDHSDLFVYVETGFLKLPSELSFATAAPGGRFVRITLNVPELDDRLIAWLAHELQHAVEIAGAPAVVNTAALVRFYEKVGDGGVAAGLCTREARKVTGLVAAELRATPNARR